MRLRDLALLALIPIGIIIAGGTFTGKKLTRLVVYFKSLRVDSFSLGKLVLKINLVVENPNIRPITLNEVTGRINYGGKQISDFSLYDKKIVIPPRGTETIRDIKFRVEAFEMVNELLDIVSSRSLKDFLISGSIKAEGLTFPFSEEITS
ncbi:hypothetical protein ES705_06385 [subsurface metagenome]